ncbi:MAG TPA: cupredoxin family copper-binding protein [Ramlibacter sp.]|jgi:plastocyanin|nr:cupredoxin family copper-binding protein [Ramlibacter sp.]
MRSALAVALAVAVTGAALAASTHEIKIEGMQFPHATVSVNRGDTVTWRNNDVVPHTVTAPGRFDSGAIAPGKTFSRKMDRPGTYDYVCTYHPGMKGRIQVK